MTARALGVALLVSVAGRQGGAAIMENAQRDAIVAAVEARMRSFEAAERSRDPDKFLAHFAAVPEFQVYDDGRRGTHATMVAGVRGGFQALRSLEVTYGDLQVLVLGAEHALLTATFRRQMVIESTGATKSSQGAVSWLWRKIDGQWLIVYGHVSHPATAAP